MKIDMLTKYPQSFPQSIILSVILSILSKKYENIKHLLKKHLKKLYLTKYFYNTKTIFINLQYYFLLFL